MNKKKFTTNIDDEADKARARNQEQSKRKNLTSVEPFWQDFNSTITDICRQKEEPHQAKLGRTRGPSQPQARNKKMQMNMTMNSFKMGQGSVESDHAHVGHASQREKHVGKLQPLQSLKAAKPLDNQLMNVNEEDGKNIQSSTITIN